ncbi:hypothetical protein DMP14_30940 [Pseudonocardia sp. Ae707_Ps2]
MAGSVRRFRNLRGGAVGAGRGAVVGDRCGRSPRVGDLRIDGGADGGAVGAVPGRYGIERRRRVAVQAAECAGLGVRVDGGRVPVGPRVRGAAADTSPARWDGRSSGRSPRARSDEWAEVGGAGRSPVGRAPSADTSSRDGASWDGVSWDGAEEAAAGSGGAAESGAAVSGAAGGGAAGSGAAAGSGRATSRAARW